MPRKPHPSARTTPRLRREIRQSGESNRALAARLGLNPKTVAKWRGRRSIFDAPRGPKRPISTALTPAEEALVVIFRQRTSLPLDDCLARLTPLIPALSRSALHRCLRRYRISRIPKGRPEKLRARQIPDSSAHFTIEIHALTYGLAGSFFYVAINFAKFVFAKLVGEVSADAAAAFLEGLIIHAPIGVATVETNNHEAFSDSEESPWDPKHPSRLHPFAEACRRNFIGHIVVQLPNPAPRIVSKGW